MRQGIGKKKDKKEASFADDLKKGWKAVACNKGLLTLVVMAALMTFCMGGSIDFVRTYDSGF